MNDPVHSGGGVKTLVNAMSYDLVSVCTEVQSTVGMVDEVVLEIDVLVDVVVVETLALDDEGAMDDEAALVPDVDVKSGLW